MNKNKIVQFAQSLILLPFITGVAPLSDMLPIEAKPETFHSVFIKKSNIDANGIFAFNQAVDQEALILEAKARAVDEYFKKRNMPLHGTGMKMVVEAEKNNLDWRLVAAVAVRESTGGKFACKKATYNPFGWGSCKIGFDSYHEAIEIVAKNMGGNNPNTARYYAGKDTKAILQAYNPPSIVARYAYQVMAIMDAISEAEITLPENA